ncbi:ChrR family anti-sigma-E factor [Rhodalgimonas zhirmunskyi]|uniref:ChrR family anti-sigma-E factor n=1 Tax=Rhodalgimonas zhirmunskyi TaxID=2964767 RepID=A0AAJ1U8C1_9RHOB|nr:ChrR family anti-sigma-E factor [Rhodoalgimonas zhirmunskyi]MDQ2095485.1 ChrR family anti-sigma-E factor [Rhodoalgimonas zhirmunskyi]
MNRNATHHIPDEIIEAYASGLLPHAFSVVVAAHVSLCDKCRATAEACEAVGGVALDHIDGEAPAQDLRARTLSMLDDLPDADQTHARLPRNLPITAPQPARRGIFPGAVAAELGDDGPRWKSLGAGIRQQILTSGPDGTVRLLYIPAGKAVPDHGHGGLEMTLVLQGSFSDHTGHFAKGDVQVVEDDLEHTPIADDGPACICLAATDAPLRFNAMIPRLLQRVFRI